MSGISGLNAYSYQNRSWAAWGRSDQNKTVGQAPAVLTAQRAAQPESPVQPVTPVRAAAPADGKQGSPGLSIRQGADPVEMAVRMRIQYADGSGETADAALKLQEGKSAQEVMEEGECQTCKERKYQDGSDDMGVSFQTPAHIAPDAAAATVRGHEQEHVVREQAKAQREDRKVVSQSVSLHTDICPECGRVYISGGTTRTVTKADSQGGESAQQQGQNQDGRVPFSAVA